MNNTETSSPAPKSSLLKKLGITGIIVAGLLVVAYFVATSTAMLKGVILPQVSKKLNAEITVEDADISPFSRVVNRKLTVKTTGTEPLFTCGEVRARYSLLDIISGKINVEEVALVSPVITLVRNADGTSNLDPLTKSDGKKEEPKPAGDSKPPVVNLKKLSIDNATVRIITHLKTGGKQVIELTGLNLNVTDVGNSKSGKLTLASNLAIDQGLPAPTNGVLQARTSGNFTFGLDAALKPVNVKGDNKFEITGAQGPFKDLAALVSTLDCDLTPTEIKQLVLQFSQAGKNLGSLAVNGPFDPAKTEGKLNLTISAIDRQVLNLAGAAAGIDFGSTTISSTNRLEVTQAGKVILLNGRLAANALSITQKGQTTPAIDLVANYDLNVDQSKSNALVQAFSILGSQKQKTFLQGTLAKPMKLDWGKADAGVDESAFNLAVTDFNLTDWRAFLGTNLISGRVNLGASVLSQQAGKQLKLDLTNNVTGLSARFATNQLDQADVATLLRATMADFNQVRITELTTTIAHQGQGAVALQANGTYAIKAQDADFQTGLTASLPRLAALLARPDVKASGGLLKFTGHLTQKNLMPGKTNDLSFDRAVVGSLALEAFTGQAMSNRFDRFEAAFDCDVAMNGDQVTIKKLGGALKQAGLPGGSLSVTGIYDLATKNGQVGLQLVDLNQNALKSFVAAALGELTLASASINASTTAKFDAKGDSTVKGDIKVLNLLITDPKGQLPKVPITAEVLLDVGLKGGLADIRQFNGNLKQGALPGGSFEVTGNYHLSNKVGQAALKLTDLNQNALRPLLAPSLGDKSLTSISIDANANAKYDAKGESSVKGAVRVANLLVRDPKGTFPKSPTTAEVNLDASLKNGLADIRQFVGKILQNNLPAGGFSVTGKYDLTNQVGQASLKLTDFNQNAFGPVLAASLGDKKLTSVSVNATADASYNAKGSSSVKADVQVANLLLQDPAGSLPKTPLALGLTVDAGMQKQVVDLRQLALKLTPTTRAQNILQLAGTVDTTRSNAIAGNLKLTSAGLDFTTYYDMFAGPQNTNAAAAPQPAPASTANPNKEPDAINLPLQNFTFDVNLARVFLREIDIANLLATAKINGGKVEINPVQFSLNGAPVAANVQANVGVPGYQYGVALTANRVPLEPFANSFGKAAKGSFVAFLNANAQIAGSGTTGTSLQRYLQGKVDFSLTNANIQLIGEKTQKYLVPIATILRVQEVVQSPLNHMIAQATIGNGTINLQQFLVESPAFQGLAAGTVSIASVLTNSPINRIPVDVLLRRSLAIKASLAPASTPATTEYVKLPNFVKVGGTVGNAQVETDKLVITSIIANSTVGALGGIVPGNVGNAIRGIGGLLGGQPAQPSTPATGLNPLIPAPQTPGTKPTTNTAKPSPFDLFKLIPKK
ncbi:hypothetical protein LBMAG56_45180 [Verrucomicrobiota bacterium]|nr:hypothetical protein LBMAG56_45180 [Verrucomicrobiota bacterium]